MPRRRTPQEKKQLSLLNDRRNNYGENSKASRKNIPRNKAFVNRANRHADRQALVIALGSHDAEQGERADLTVRGRRRRVWRKWPDISLGQVLAGRSEHE
ncbi:hypothetical protein GCM10010413_16450 [Promicromonospora sukumoe]|uniref:Uncharacterized protein n=1 Tax=Promicromonospora sukumoe TaxID=88382 RepID=A0A7W3JAE5_9MICO|nr:hypothetical protein [Promicromonospora sukumoe]MBA8809134.1 hypothetical protein [Promicromonospora sukumoe]